MEVKNYLDKLKTELMDIVKSEEYKSLPEVMKKLVHFRLEMLIKVENSFDHIFKNENNNENLIPKYWEYVVNDIKSIITFIYLHIERMKTMLKDINSSEKENDQSTST